RDAGQAGPVPVGFRTHVARRPVVVGETVERLQIERTERAAHLPVAAHAGHLAGVNPAGRPGGRADVHGLEGLLVEGRLDVQAVVEGDIEALHATPVVHAQAVAAPAQLAD